MYRYSLIANVLVFTLTAAHYVSAAAINNCKKICVRKEVHDLTNDEWNTFVRAIEKVNEKNGNGESVYDRFVQVHNQFMFNDAHRSAQFLPWHRYYLADLEQKMQQHEPNACIPYWDWSREYNTIPQSAVWGRIGRSQGPGRCIVGGSFDRLYMRSTIANVPSPVNPSQYCVTRDFDMDGPSDDSLPSSEMIAQLMIDANFDFATFTGRLEAIHGYLHVYIGGEMGSSVSPNDIAFLFHHAYLDKVWSDFQTYQITQGGRRANLFNGRLRNGDLASAEQTMLPFNIPVKDVLDTRDVCVNYARPGEPKIPENTTTIAPSSTSSFTSAETTATTSKMATMSTNRATVTKTPTATNATLSLSIATVTSNSQAASPTSASPPSTRMTPTSTVKDQTTSTFTGSNRRPTQTSSRISIPTSTLKDQTTSTLTGSNPRPTQTYSRVSRPSSTSTSPSHGDYQNKDHKFVVVNNCKYGPKRYLPKDYKPPTKPLKPLPFKYVKMIFNENDAQDFDSLTQEAKEFANTGSYISKTVVAKLKAGETIELPPMPVYDANRPYTGASALQSNAMKFMKFDYSLGMILISMTIFCI